MGSKRIAIVVTMTLLRGMKIMDKCESTSELVVALNERAIQIVMQFYGVSREDALSLYRDEVEAAERLVDRFESECG